MGLPDEFEGKPMQTVLAHFAFDDGKNSTITFFIGAKDGLLHQLRQSYDGMGTIVETHRDMKINPVLPAETWKWTPPAALKSIEYFVTLDTQRGKIGFAPGEKLPPFRSLDLAGKAVKLTDFTGQVVVLYFFSIGHAAFEVPKLVELQKQWGEKVAVVGVSMDGRRERVQEFVEKNRLTFPVLFDGKAWKNDVAQLYGVRSLPTTLLIDQTGVLKEVSRRPTDMEFEGKVQALLR